MEDKLKEWKEQWNNGDVKFVSELFELAVQLQEANGKIEKLESDLKKSRAEAKGLLAEQSKKVKKAEQ